MKLEKEEIDISGLDKAALLAALYNSAKAQGLGYVRARIDSMSIEEAQLLLRAREGRGNRKYFDYLHGRVMKIDLSGDVMSCALYNRDNGPGLAQAIVKTLRKATA